VLATQPYLTDTTGKCYQLKVAATVASHTAKFGLATVNISLVSVLFDRTEAGQSLQKLPKVDRVTQQTPSQHKPITTPMC